MERLSDEDLVTQQNVAAYVRVLVAWARVTGPRSVLNRPAIGLHFALNLLYLPLLPVQWVSTFILGLLVSVTFGLLLIPLSVVLWWPFLGFLLGSSWLWSKVGLSRPVLLLPGVVIAEAASVVVALMPSMGEWQSRGMKLALCESWPHSYSLWRGHLSGFNNQSLKETESKPNVDKERHEILTEESQEEYRHSVWEIYRKEWETASPEKKTELNKRMHHWQELMKSGLTAMQAYIRVMGEETDTSPKLISDNDKYSRGERLVEIYRHEISRTLWGWIIFGLVIVVLWSVATHFLPSGWWILVINIFGFLSTALIGWTIRETLKVIMSSGIAFLISIVLWLLIVIGGRTLILGLLDAWTGG